MSREMEKDIRAIHGKDADVKAILRETKSMFRKWNREYETN